MALSEVVVTVYLPFFGVPAQNISVAQPRQFTGDTVYLTGGCSTSFGTSYSYDQQNNKFVIRVCILIANF